MKLAIAICGAVIAANIWAKTDKISLGGDWEFRREGEAWRTVTVPHDWSIETTPKEGGETGPEWGFYEAGKAEYTRTFSLDRDDLKKHLELVFDGVMRDAEVIVNDSAPFKGSRYGYTGFRVPLAGVAREGENTIAVKVDNSNLPGSRWYMGSGIVRNVWLEKRDIPYVEPLSLDVRTSLDGKVEISGVLVDGSGSKYPVKETFKVNDPILWTPETPHLYNAEFHGEKVRYGIRTVETNAKDGFLLNGKSVELHGACVHHDHGPLGAASWPEAELRKARQLKAAGFNAVRTSHNPVAEEFLSACDEVGLLVIDDMFDGREVSKKNGEYAGEIFKTEWRKDLETTVRRDRVHPSVVMWSIGNEILERSTPEAVATTKAMRELCNSLDGTRPVTQALQCWAGDGDWRSQQPMANELDVVGYNYVEYFTEGDHEKFPDRVILYTETFPRAAADTWRRIIKHPYVIGECVWTGIDYLGETGIGRNFYSDREKPGESWSGVPQFPWHGAYCGDIDMTGYRKPISHWRQTLWDENAPTSIAVREPDGWRGKIATTSWSVWPTHEHWNFEGWENKDITVEVYTRKPEVRLYLNGRKVGEMQVSEDTAWKAEFTIPYQPGELKAVAGDERAILRTAGEPTGIRYSREKIGRLTWVTAEVIDAKGTVCPHADKEIDFSFPGKLLGTCSGNMADNAPAKSRKRKAWHGRAMAVIEKR